MKGLELAGQYYEAYGKPMLEERFPDLLWDIAAGLVGHGSECFGYDDELSTDHDYGPSFCLWLPRALYEKHGQALQAAYLALPGEFLGFSPRVEEETGKGRVGALCLEDFYRGILNLEGPPKSDAEWLFVPEEALATATNGAVFADPSGRFTKVRKALLSYYPEGVWRRKLADALARAAKAGQYNYARCLRRGERIAALLSLSEFVREAMRLAYLLNRRYAPYDKWMHRGLRDLPLGAEIGDMLNLLCEREDPAERTLIIEAVCSVLAQMLNEQGISSHSDAFLQAHVAEVIGG